MGSLLPLSNSSKGLRLFFKFRPLDLKIENTEAESVEDIVAERRSAVKNPTPADSIVIPNTYHTTKPVKKTVNKTPIVAKMIPWGRMGFISDNFVSIPPEKRMIQSATEPIVCA